MVESKGRGDNLYMGEGEGALIPGISEGLTPWVEQEA